MRTTKEITTLSALQTKNLGAMLAAELRGGEIICLSGDLGAGKTTFTQGLLKGLGVKGPYTSPTFTIIKEYEVTKEKMCKKGFLLPINHHCFHVYHIDAYRIKAKDLLDLGFADFAGKKDSITIVEWPENIQQAIPTHSLWITFTWVDEKKRDIVLFQKK